MEYVIVEGSTGGKGGSGGGGSEAPNTLQNNTLVQLLHLLGEGPIQGLATGDGQSIFLNKVPLQGANGVFNYGGAAFSLRTGTANQTYIPGFANVSSVVTTDVQVVAASPQIYTVSANNIDAVTVTFGLPNGLRTITSQGNIDGYTVGVKVETKPHSSNTWAVQYDVVKNDKTDGNYQWQQYFTRPSGATNALWDLRITRTTPDDATANVISSLYFVNAIEIEEIQEAYDGTAVCGVTLNAQEFGTSIPVVSFLLKGVTINVPSNYNANTRVYTGSWDGTFQTAFSNNPAWVLYDLLTNTQYGGGVYGITEDVIDKYSFYDAGVFCDANVASGVVGVNEPRFTFDAPIQQRGDLLSTALQIAGMMNGNLIWAGGLLTLNQDRPANSVMAITKQNILNGMFNYVGTPLSARTTAVNVTYADKNNYYYPKISTTQNTAASNTYGYNSADVAAFGATSEGQAIRSAKWYLYTSLNTTDTAHFTMGLNGNFLGVGDVVDVYDEDYTAQTGSGRILSANANTVHLDQAVTISGASPKIGILLSDGITYTYFNIASPGSGTSNTITIANTFSQIPNTFNDYIILSAIKPRQFKIVDIKQSATEGQLDFTGVLYSNANYAYIESNVALPNIIYSAVATGNVSDPQNVAVTEMAMNVVLGEAIRRGLLITWSPPAIGVARSYQLQYRYNNGTYKVVSGIKGQSYDLENLAPGEYDFVLQSVNPNGLKSSGNNFTTYTISTNGGNTTSLLCPTNFTVNGSGNSFTGQDVHMQWTNPANNAYLLSGNSHVAVLKDFLVEISNSGGSILNTYTVKPVAPGANATFLYTYSDNVKDYGTASRLVYATVMARDTNYNTNAASDVIFTNPTPTAPTGTVTGVQNGAYVSVQLPNQNTVSDLAGLMVWRNTTNNFTLTGANLIYDGLSSLVFDAGLTGNTTYFYAWALYDTYGKSNTGSGLSVSGYHQATALNTAVPSGSSLPGTGSEGNLFFDTTDGQLYRWHSGAWTVAVPATNITGTIGSSQIANGAVGTSQLGNGAVTTINVANGAITGLTIAANTVATNNIVLLAVTEHYIVTEAGPVDYSNIA